MFDDYEELFDDVEGANAIIEQAKADLFDLLTDGVKDIIHDAACAKAELENAQSELRTIKHMIEVKKRDFEALQEKCEQAETRDIPRKYIGKFVRDATGYFAPGDTVWYIASKYKRIHCAMCNGQKDVVAKIGDTSKKICCPECNGYGEKTITEKVVEKRTVKRVDLKLCFDSGCVNYWDTDSVFLNGDEYSSNVKNIFRTEEEAFAALKEGRVT